MKGLVIATALLAASGFGLTATASAAPQLNGVDVSQTAIFGRVPASPETENAVRAALNYLAMIPFSRQGLIDQLIVGDGYTAAEATAAVNSLTVDWNQQAANAAKNYLATMPFSKQGLLDQLVVGDGYTQSQAMYGVASVYQ